jgi:Kef-type K+ transport system membrane component KefB
MNIFYKSLLGFIFFVFSFFLTPSAFAAESASGTGHGGFALTFLWIVVILMAAKIASLIEKWGQPAVLGELVIGIVLGNLALLGIHWFDGIVHDGILKFLAELGVIILLFQIGLESNISEMRRVGGKALIVAIIGVVVPFVLGAYIVGPMLLPGLPFAGYLFLGAALTATSVGITARVFKDLGKLNTSSARIVLGAAVIDDVMGLIILAVVSAIATVGAISAGLLSIIIGKAILFLIGAIVLGQLLAPWISRIFSKLNTGVGMKFSLAISFGLLFAFIAESIGLAAIVGAFAAGLILDDVTFRFFRDPEIVSELKDLAKDTKESTKNRINGIINRYSHNHINDLIEPLAYIFIPMFFVMTGMSVNLEALLNPKTLMVALAISAIAILGKIVAGLGAGRSNKLLVGFGMVPRGEVGLIFATIGSSLGVVSQELFSVIVAMVIITTLITPNILCSLIRKEDKRAESKRFSLIQRLHLEKLLVFNPIHRHHKH